MSVYGGFAASVMGMWTQSRSMENLGLNIANVNTGGYKRIDTHFKTVISDKFQAEGDLGGVRPKEFNRITQQGVIAATDRDLDLAINGTGFFILNSAVDGSGDTYYGRDGSFVMANGEETTVTETGGRTYTIKEGYLADKNGYFVQGWAADENGDFDTASTSLTSLRIDQFAFYDSPEQTTEATVQLNLPADAAIGDIHRYSTAFYDTAGNLQSAVLNFTKTAQNEWTVQPFYNNGVDSLAAQTMTFDTDADLLSPTSLTYSFTWTNGETTAVTMDISPLTQYASQDMIVRNYDYNGNSGGRLTRIEFDTNGKIYGSFANGISRPLYQLPLAEFQNPDLLTPADGNVFAQNELTSDATYVAADINGYAMFNPMSRELSNVDLADEFSKMIMTQNAYNSSATVFRTVDEMYSVAKDLIM